MDQLNATIKHLFPHNDITEQNTNAIGLYLYSHQRAHNMHTYRDWTPAMKCYITTKFPECSNEGKIKWSTNGHDLLQEH